MDVRSEPTGTDLLNGNPIGKMSTFPLPSGKSRRKRSLNQPSWTKSVDLLKGGKFTLQTLGEGNAC
jgi:hypothetical protein